MICYPHIRGQVEQSLVGSRVQSLESRVEAVLGPRSLKMLLLPIISLCFTICIPANPTPCIPIPKVLSVQSMLTVYCDCRRSPHSQHTYSAHSISVPPRGHDQLHMRFVPPLDCGVHLPQPAILLAAYQGPRGQCRKQPPRCSGSASE